MKHTLLVSFAALALSSQAVAQESAAPPAGGAATSETGLFQEIEAPQIERSGVFVTQIGEGNRASVTQSNASSRAQISQGSADRPGVGNTSDVEQSDTGAHFARIAQEGEENAATVRQGGDGETYLLLVQDGQGNSATINQTQLGSGLSGAEVVQTGERNALSLTQGGTDNQARLMQDGDDNLMTVEQSGLGNRLAWQQIGNNLSDIEVYQDGTGQAMEITQTNSGIMSAPPASGG
ncbi:MAG: hypothetical protein V2J14_05720 [Erythrobacter sp.]|jgi:hypothetical protein|nr:hypothetical protein [Erythrobacter sp.]